VLWLTPAILSTQEAEIRRIMIQGQLRQKVHKIPYQPIKSGHGGTGLSLSCLGSINRTMHQPRHKLRLSSEKYLKQKVLGAWLKWQSTYLPNIRNSIQPSVPLKRNKYINGNTIKLIKNEGLPSDFKKKKTTQKLQTSGAKATESRSNSRECKASLEVMLGRCSVHFTFVKCTRGSEVH
jgi:hypothetical protein